MLRKVLQEKFRRKSRLVGVVIGFLVFASPLFGQIIPPGMGKTNSASWLAIGLNQKLDTLKNGGWSSTTYVGIGGISNRNSFNPVKNQGIFILNQEFYHKFHPNWEYSLALSYRRQSLYDSEEPFDKATPSLKQEFRYYSRFSYLLKTSIVDVTPTVRQEFIKYFNPDFTDYTESFRIRTRLRMKFSFNLTEDKKHKILVYSEQLFSTFKRLELEKWTNFKYTDSRFSLYYSLSLGNVPLTINLGYMNNLIGTKDLFAASHFVIDLIWKRTR